MPLCTGVSPVYPLGLTSQRGCTPGVLQPPLTVAKIVADSDDFCEFLLVVFIFLRYHLGEGERYLIHLYHFLNVLVQVECWRCATSNANGIPNVFILRSQRWNADISRFERELWRRHVDGRYKLSSLQRPGNDLGASLDDFLTHVDIPGQSSLSQFTDAITILVEILIKRLLTMGCRVFRVMHGQRIDVRLDAVQVINEMICEMASGLVADCLHPE